jgi:hypothetical protein
MRQLVYIDWESFYAPKEKYDLKHISVVEYVRSPRFKDFGAAVALGDETPTWIPAKDLDYYFSMLGDRFGWENIAVVGHNLKFDGFILRERYGVVPGQYIDTKGMSKAVLGKTIRSHSLKDIVERFGLPRKEIEVVENMAGVENPTPEQLGRLITYCIHDVELCRGIFKLLAKEFPAAEYAALHRTIQMFVEPKLELDVERLRELNKLESERRIKIFETIGIPKSEFASNEKFAKLLTSKGLEVPMKPSPKKKNEDGSAKMIPALALGDVDFLEMIESEDEILQDLCEARVAAKSTLLETRSAKLAAIGETGPWSFDVDYSGADQTHRFSGGKGAGGNPQNFTNPAKIRDAQKKKMATALRGSVKTPAGFELVVGDFAQIEFRWVAYTSRDPGLLAAIEKGVDIYCDIASVFYGRKITKADEKERGFGKQAILGLGYGMGWKKFKRTVRLQTGQTITDDEAKRAVDIYRTRYAGVQALWNALDDTIQVMADPNGYRKLSNIPVEFRHERIVLPSGLKIRYPNLRQMDGERGHPEWVYDVYHKGRLETRKLYGGKILENICQALAGELCKDVMERMDNGITKDEVTGQVHDELHYRARRNAGWIVAQKLRREMATPPKWFPLIKLDAEVHVGANWGEAK